MLPMSVTMDERQKGPRTEPTELVFHAILTTKQVCNSEEGASCPSL